MGRKQQLRRARNKTKKNDIITREATTARPPGAAATAVAPLGVENPMVPQQITMTTAEEVAYTVTALKLREKSPQFFGRLINDADKMFPESDFLCPIKLFA